MNFGYDDCIGEVFTVFSFMPSITIGMAMTISLNVTKNWPIGVTVDSNCFLLLQGRFTMAAKHHITIAEIYETEVIDIDKAIANYEQAADYYKGEESNRYVSHLTVAYSLLPDSTWV